MKGAPPAEPAWHPETDPARLIALSDGIFSVAMTLAVVQVMPPDLAARLKAEGAAKLLVELIPDFVGIVMTFLLVGFYWVSHHRIFSYIRRVDRGFLFLNLYFLLGVTLMPFFVLLNSGTNQDPVAVAAYAAYVAVLGLLLNRVWSYATRKRRLVDADLDVRIIRYNHYRSWATAGVFLLSCPIAFFSINLARCFWILLFFNGRIASGLAKRRA